MRGAGKYRKVRKIETGNRKEQYGITIPRDIAQMFMDQKLHIYTLSNSIIIEKSGSSLYI